MIFKNRYLYYPCVIKEKGFKIEKEVMIVRQE